MAPQERGFVAIAVVLLVAVAALMAGCGDRLTEDDDFSAMSLSLPEAPNGGARGYVTLKNSADSTSYTVALCPQPWEKDPNYAGRKCEVRGGGFDRLGILTRSTDTMWVIPDIEPGTYWVGVTISGGKTIFSEGVDSPEGREIEVKAGQWTNVAAFNLND